MSVGLLIITHDRIGGELLDSAAGMLGGTPLPARFLPVSNDSDPDAVEQDAAACVRELDEGDGVLILTDLYGSTPSNIANRLCSEYPVIVIAGVNLPMLIRVLNYPRLDLAGIAGKAISGGRDGVVPCQPEVDIR